MDLLEARAHLANSLVAFHESFHGASFAEVEGGLEIAKYLQLILQSSAFPFFSILTDAQFGVFVDAIHLESVLKMPVVPFEKLTESQRRSAGVLAERLGTGLDEDLAASIDALVFGTFGLTHVECAVVRDTLETALPSSDSKRRSVAFPEAAEKQGFIETLQASLARVLAAVGVRASVQNRDDLRWAPWCVLEITMSEDGRAAKRPPPMKLFLEEADTNGASMVTVRVSESTWFVGLLERYSQWTSTRARLLASNLLAERSTT